MPQANIRNDAPTIGVRNTDIPKVGSRFSSIRTDAVESHISIGTPIGLLLVWTYATQIDTSTPAIYKSDDVPVVKIRNTD